MGGLFELVGSKADGAIVRSLEDGVTKFVSSRIHSFSHLESIEVYTENDNINLVEVFVAMNASTEPLPAEKDAAAVKAYFGKVFSTMDFERVYASDMKKMVRWFGILKKIGVEFSLEAPDAEQTTEPAEVVAEQVVEEAPKKKATRKKKESAE